MPWKELNARPMEVFMCSIFKREGYDKASDGSSSTLTDVWSVKIRVLLLGTDLIPSFLMKFSNRTRKALQSALVLRSQESPSGLTSPVAALLFTLLVGPAAHVLE